MGHHADKSLNLAHPITLQTLSLCVFRDNTAMQAVYASTPCLQTGLVWSNSFFQLGSAFFTPLAPQPVSTPYWVGRNELVAAQLGLDLGLLRSGALLQGFAGNEPISGTQPLASVYSGHQFGGWAGQLGDGRAILLGQTNGFEVQLKGSGLTPYSRHGDGRAVLRSSIREYLGSLAMYALGIPTTQALCVVGSDVPVWRETPETLAVVTRVAPSFIRFGHFEHFAARQQHAQLKTLADYVIKRFYPACNDCPEFPGNPYAALLDSVTKRTAQMVAQWQVVGFCHGVMNTDNMSILGLTLDYGPFQFMDAYAPGHICNHSDSQGRYAFDAQPDIAHWNLYALAQALLPLIQSQSLAVEVLDTFYTEFDQCYLHLMCRKLGWPASTDPHVQGRQRDLVQALLQLMAREGVDYSLFWRRLSLSVKANTPQPARDLFLDRDGFDHWMLQYLELSSHIDHGLQVVLMMKNNPVYVLRNYMAEEAIAAAKCKDFSVLADLQRVLQNPLDAHPGFVAWSGLPPDWASGITVSCSS